MQCTDSGRKAPIGDRTRRVKGQSCGQSLNNWGHAGRVCLWRPGPCARPRGVQHDLSTARAASQVFVSARESATVHRWLHGRDAWRIKGAKHRRASWKPLITRKRMPAPLQPMPRSREWCFRLAKKKPASQAGLSCRSPCAIQRPRTIAITLAVSRPRACSWICGR